MIVRALSPSKLKYLVPFSQIVYGYVDPLYLPLIFEPKTRSSHPQSPIKTLSSLFFLSPFSSQSKPLRTPTLPLNRDGNYDESTSQTLLICPGCGVPMQDLDPKQAGFFVRPSPKNPDYKSPINRNPVVDEEEISNSLKRGILKELVEPKDDDFSKSLNKDLPEKPVVCVRCHSLRHYGKVKDPTVENLLPDFDFDHTVGRKLNSTMGARTVVLMVVDAADFDGSFPRKVAKLVSAIIDENSAAWKEGKSGNVPRMVLVVTKIDLLPSSLSPTRFEHWVRTRAREGGANKITSVHLVSALRNWGLKNLCDDVVGLAGPRGNVWAIGAQNAGKSTLINSIGKYVGGKITHLTEAPVPGTTLGIVKVEGVLPGQVKLFDTPGLLHPYQIYTRLMREEQKLVQISKELRPRTYRIKAGHSIHIGGLMRLDIEKSSVDTIYVTVWSSPYIPLHMGKTESVHKMQEDHFGRQLQPPIGEKRTEELGKWIKREFLVSGNSWDSSSVDIATAGLGWFAVGLKGEAFLGVWTYDGIDVSLRNALIPHRAQNFEVAGFTVSKIVSKADQASNKLHHQCGKKPKQSHPKAEASAV
ncbi:Nitric-oxide synthase (NADPH dependent) [Bertholletia excelsa]